jgi:hypothetical protein
MNREWGTAMGGGGGGVMGLRDRGSVRWEVQDCCSRRERSKCVRSIIKCVLVDVHTSVLLMIIVLARSIIKCVEYSSWSQFLHMLYSHHPLLGCLDSSSRHTSVNILMS